MNEMKRLYKLIPIIIIGLAFTLSCEKDKPELTYTGEDFVAFATTSVNVEETIGVPVQIVVMRVTENAAAATVNVAITSPDGSAIEGTNYNLIYPADGALNFGAGEYTDTIKIEVIDNGDEDGAKTLSFELSSAPAGFNLGLPGPDGNQKVCELVISDNDCTFNTADFSGKVSGVEFYPSSEYPTDVEFSFVEELDGPIYVYEVHGIMQSVYAGWGETVDAASAGTGSNENVAIVYFDFTDPINPTVYLEEQNLSTTEGGAWIYDIYNNPDLPSKFSTCEKTIELNYLINVAEPGTDYGARACYVIGEFGVE